MAYSRMGLQLREADETFHAHESYYTMSKDEEFTVQIIENVPEYGEDVVRSHLPHSSWEVISVCLDPRLFGQAAARPRRYFVCWKKGSVDTNPNIKIEDVIMALRTYPVIDPIKYFWQNLGPTNLSDAQDQGFMFKR